MVQSPGTSGQFDVSISMPATGATSGYTSAIGKGQYLTSSGGGEYAVVDFCAMLGAGTGSGDRPTHLRIMASSGTINGSYVLMGVRAS